MTTDVARLKQTLDGVLEREPNLTSSGFGIFYDRKKTAEQNEEKFQREREQLRGAGQSIFLAHEWLRRNIAPIKTSTQLSYAMKHVVEKAIGQYVSNGELIAAALMAGYPMKHSGGSNCLLGMSQRDVNRAREANR